MRFMTFFTSIINEINDYNIFINTYKLLFERFEKDMTIKLSSDI